MLRQVLADGRVTVARIEGAIALYLLAALVFAHVYGVLEMANAAAFTLGPGNGPVHTLDRRFLYFSLITQTSTGFAFVLDCHVWSNNSVRVTARNVSASTVDLAAAPLTVRVTKRQKHRLG